MMRGDSSARGLEVELADEDRLDLWRVRYLSFPDGSQLAADLATLSAVLEVRMHARVRARVRAASASCVHADA